MIATKSGSSQWCLYFCCIFTLFLPTTGLFFQLLMDISVERRVLSREELLAFKWSKFGGSHSISAKIKKPFRGCCAGAQVKSRRWIYKPFLPSIIMGNGCPTKVISWRYWWRPRGYAVSAVYALPKPGWIKTSQTPVCIYLGLFWYVQTEMLKLVTR